MTLPVGASSGTLSHAAIRANGRTTTSETSAMPAERCDTICDANNNSLMSLRGQATPSRLRNGYAMAALLVAMAVMAVLMSVAMPVWRHEAQREKEEELVFRGQQYVRAIRLFQARTQTFPTSVDMLVQGRYLRKKYKDPITNEDFLPIPAGGAIPGPGRSDRSCRPAAPGGRGAAPAQPVAAAAPGRSGCGAGCRRRGSGSSAPVPVPVRLGAAAASRPAPSPAA